MWRGGPVTLAVAHLGLPPRNRPPRALAPKPSVSGFLPETAHQSPVRDHVDSLAYRRLGRRRRHDVPLGRAGDAGPRPQQELCREALDSEQTLGKELEQRLGGGQADVLGHERLVAIGTALRGGDDGEGVEI